MSAEQAYLFVHALVRDAAYELHLPTERGELHRLAISAFESCLAEDALTPHALELAGHAQLARGESDDAELLQAECRYLDTGYRYALSRDQMPEAVAALERLTGLLPERSGARREALYELAIHATVFDRERGLRLLDECERLSEDDVYRGKVLRGRAMIRFMLKEREPGQRILEQAVALHESAGDPVQLALTRNALARILLEEGKIAEAETMLRGVLPVAESIDDKRYLGGAQNTLGMAASRTGRFAEAKQWFSRALETYEGVGLTRYLVASLQGLGRALNELGELEAAADTMARCVDVCHRSGLPEAECTISVSLGKVQIKLGRHAEAAASLRRAVRLGRERGLPEWVEKAQQALAGLPA